MARKRWWDPYDLAKRLQSRLGERVSALVRLWAKRLFIAGFIFLVLFGVGIEYSSQPRFCVLCHYMRPYYESWQASSHHNVPCIECHFPPGIKPMIRVKFDALNQVTKYITRQYGTRPWTEIEDASCLRSGCHATRLLQGKVEFHPSDLGSPILFDHTPHMTSFRRVTRLRCTSCHSQIVQGQHIEVTTTTCFICHFKNIPQAESMRQCTTCHKLPIKATKGRPAYEHQPVEARGVSCVECHADVIQGTGAVPQDRCLTCHSQPELLAQRHNIELIHLKHVTEHGVDCTRCHQEIQHRLPSEGVPTELDCGSCHPDHHQASLDLYVGRGATGAHPVQSPMAEVRVSCVSCHRTHRDVNGRGVELTAGPAGCMNCHGEKYGRFLAEWQAEASTSVVHVEAALARAQRELKAAGSRPSAPRAREMLASAEHNVTLIRLGGGVHNIDYAREALDAATSAINRAMALIGSTYRAQPPRATVPLPGQTCLQCHESAPTADIPVFGLTFSHQKHVLDARLKCTQCHYDVPPSDPQHGRRRITAADCRECHAKAHLAPHARDWLSTHGPQAKGKRETCRVCHTADWCLSCHGTPMPHGPNWLKPAHGKTATASPAVCEKCHRSEFCDVCHGSRGIRPASHEAKDWLKSHGKDANEAYCKLCHGDNACARCHDGIKMPHPDNWAMTHKTSATSNPASCALCHDSKFCMLCHQGSPPASHTTDFRQKHGEHADEALCADCHGKDPCMACHKVQMPHPQGWAMEHKSVASFKADGPCLYCHKIDLCKQCHADAAVQPAATK